MPRKKKNGTREEVTHLTAQLEGCEISLDAGVNSHTYAPQYAFSRPENEPLYTFGARVDITSTITGPEDRAGDTYEVIVCCSDTFPVLDLKLKDIQKRSKAGLPEYRKYRDRQVPVFDPPGGLGHVEKTRGKNRWEAWVWAKPYFMTYLIELLRGERQLFLEIDEHKVGRERWLKDLTIQTAQPTDK